MAKRQTIESRIVQYFRTAPLEQAELVLGLVQGEVKARRPKQVKTSKRTKQRVNGPVVADTRVEVVTA